MGIREIKNGIQAVLFASGEAMEASRLAKLFSVNTTVLDNIILGSEPSKLGFLTRKNARKKIRNRG